MEADKNDPSVQAKIVVFEDAVALYDFDMELRFLLFKVIQRIEIALRSDIIHEFSVCHGPF